MRKFLSLIFAVLLCASAGFAQTVQNRWPVEIGVVVGSSPSYTGINLNLATTQAGFSFFPSAAKTVSKVRVWDGGNTGTVTDLQCDLYSDTAGAPNASLANRTLHNAGGIPAGVVEFTGFTTPTADVAPHTMYWVLITNTTGTPASNYPAIYYAYSLPIYSTGTATWGWVKRTGLIGVWGTATPNVAGYEIEYSDGSVDGWLVYSAGASAIKVYNTGAAVSEYGASFTTRPNTSLKVRGVGWMSNKVLAPPSGLKFAIYPSTGHTVVTGGTTATISAANINTSTGYYNYAYFPATITLSASTTYKVSMIYDGVDGDTSNYYRAYQFTIPTDAQSSKTRALGPMGGTVNREVWDGSNWTPTLTEVPIFVLLLDTDGPFPAVTGGGGTGRVVPQ